MGRKILIVFIVGFVALAFFINSRPDSFRISRKEIVQAAPSVVFPHVNDLRKWDAWSPWIELDKDVKNTFSGPEEGVGSALTWSGNDEIGEGTMTITESVPNELIVFRLDFIRPFPGTNSAEFSFEPHGAGTTVTWSMSGKSNFITKAVGLFIDCDKMVGGHFEKGLTTLKRVAEGVK